MAKSFNPLTTFRKNQKVSLAFITLLSMFAFVCVGPSMFGRSNNGGGPSEANVAATWNYGNITQTEVANRLEWRQRINKFLRLIYEAANKSNPDAMMQTPRFFQPESNDGILDAMLLEKKAELLGMTVSDDAINDYINSVSNKSLDREALSEALASAVNDNRSSVNQLSDQLFENLRFELLADNFGRLLLHDAIDYDTPEQRWDYFSRLYREATVQVLPVSVSDFVSKVPTPSNDELQSMFDKYKDRLKRPSLPEPGFMVPAQAKFQYFKAVPANFLKAAEAKITDKQIDDYYEKHKENYRKSTLDDSESPPAETPKTPASPKTGPGTAAAASSPAPKTPAAPPKSDEKSKPADKTKTDGKTPPAAQGEKSSDARPAARHFGDDDLLALADTTPPASTAPTASPPAKSSAAAKAASAKADSTKAPAKPDAVKSEPAKIPPPKVEPPKAGPPTSTPPAAKTTPAKPATSTDDEFRSVNDPKVRAEIRTRLAKEAVSSQINDSFAKIRTDVQVYGRQHMDWVGNGSAAGDAPAPPDFKAIAKADGFIFGDTPMMSADEAPDVNELGKSWIYSATMRAPFGAVGFDPNLPSYMPSESETADITYLWWRTDFNKAYVPNFVDAKPQVTLAWKMIQARILAMNEAKKDAEDANKRRATLKEIFQNRPNMNVSEVGPFHWLTIDNVAMGTTTEHPISLTNLSGVDMAGEEFMHAVFKTEVGSASAAFNEPQTVAYVIQVQKLEPSEEMFRRQFLTYQEQMATSQYAGLAFSAARRSAQLFVVPAKMQAIRDELGFKRLATANSSGSQSDEQQEPPSDDEDY